MSQITAGRERASQRRVRLEGVCAQWFEVARRVDNAVDGDMGDLGVESEGDALPLWGVREVLLLGEVGSGNSEGCLRVVTILVEVW